MNALAAQQESKDRRCSRSRMNRCTLYDLVEAMCDETQPGEDHLVTEAVLDLFRTGRIRLHKNRTQLLV
jgi:hypothetical protein